MAWHVFEKLLEGVANYSTFIGKIWITFLFIFRIIMVASVGDTVYSDEQSAFTCNTLQPGCSNVCFNQFSPISQIRFWAVQILFVGTPSVVFIVFAMHKMSIVSAQLEREKEEDKNKRSGDDYKEQKSRSRTTSKKLLADDRTSSGKTSLPHYDDVTRNDLDKRLGNGVVRIQDDVKSRSSIGVYEGNNRIAEVIHMPCEKPKNMHEKLPKKDKKIRRKTVYHKDGSSEVVKTPSIARAYFAQAVIRTAVEIVFLYLQYHMYQFKVDELYVCEGFPCPKKVDCFVSRPKEKTLFLLFMYVMTGLSLFLNFLELVQLIKNFCARAFSEKPHEDRSLRRLYEQPRSYMLSYSSPRRRRHRRREAYPTLGPFPRTHNNSFSGSNDGNSMDSDYRFYDSD